MPNFVVPNSFGTPLQEKNPCHDPKDGRFASKGQGNCAPLTDLHNDLGERTFLSRAVRQKVATFTADKSFNIDRALAMAGPKFREQYLSLMEKAPGAQGEMARHLDRVAGKLGARVVPYAEITNGPGIRASMGTIKSARRLIEKTVTDNFGDLTEARDVVRASFAVDSPHQVETVMKQVASTFTVVRVKDRFVKPVEGYRDILMNVRMSNGLVGEIQIHAKPILRVKEGEGHHLYAQLRAGTVRKSVRTAISKKMTSLYNRAWIGFLAAAAPVAAHASRRFM